LGHAQVWSNIMGKKKSVLVQKIVVWSNKIKEIRG